MSPFLKLINIYFKYIIKGNCYENIRQKINSNIESICFYCRQMVGEPTAQQCLLYWINVISFRVNNTEFF